MSLCTLEFPVKHQQSSSCWLTEQLIHVEGSSPKQLHTNTSFKSAAFHHRHKNRQPKTLCEGIAAGPYTVADLHSFTNLLAKESLRIIANDSPELGRMG